MHKEFLIRNLFRLSGGTTVLACEGKNSSVPFVGRKAKLVSGNEVRQSIMLTGERQMLNGALPQSHKVIETFDTVNLSFEEAQSGMCRLLVDD